MGPEALMDPEAVMDPKLCYVQKPLGTSCNVCPVSVVGPVLCWVLKMWQFLRLRWFPSQGCNYIVVAESSYLVQRLWWVQMLQLAERLWWV
jgi:hypothetical protein